MEMMVGSWGTSIPKSLMAATVAEEEEDEGLSLVWVGRMKGSCEKELTFMKSCVSF